MSTRDSQFHRLRHRQRGLTLVEMMVAVAIAALLLAGVVQIFISSKRTYSAQAALSRVQENGRYAMQLLTTDIRKTGYTGCFTNSLSTVQNILNTSGTNTNYGWDSSTMLLGYTATSNTSPTATWDPTLDSALTSLSPAPSVGSDVITIRYMSSDGLQLASPYTTSADFLVNTAQYNADPINVGDVIMVTDCSQAAVAQITGTSNSGATQTSLAHASTSCSAGMCPGNQAAAILGFGAGSEIARFRTYAYYIATDPSTNMPALYRANPLNSTTGFGGATPLVEGVRRMEIWYGFRGKNSNNKYYYYYVPAATGLNMSQVVSVRIKLWLESIKDHVRDSSTTYHYGGNTITDHRLQETFETTITLRNRAL